MKTLELIVGRSCIVIGRAKTLSWRSSAVDLNLPHACMGQGPGWLLRYCSRDLQSHSKASFTFQILPACILIILRYHWGEGGIWKPSFVAGLLTQCSHSFRTLQP